MTERILRVVIGAAPPPRLDKALARDVPEAAALSRTRLARLIADGAVRRDGAPLRDGKAAVREGDVIEIDVPEAAPVETVAEAIPLDIRYEDEDLCVVMKPAGMVVHPAPGSPGGTLVNALLAHFGDRLSGVGGERRPGIVHRIDKDTSGLLVVAKSDRAHHGLAEQFAAHTVERRYLALSLGVPDPGDPRLVNTRGVSVEPGGVIKVTTGIARHRTDRQRQAVVFGAGRHAITRARVLESFGTPPSLALLECRLETGRTHQIRVHMAHAGHALVGDPVYGGRRRAKATALEPDAAEAVAAFPRQALHAASLGFVHPANGKTLRFDADLPRDMADLITLLRTDGPETHSTGA
ncbi:Ribosomal large subunit pseudouridine synthase D [Roseivivax jejudonensis]|uniref:Pseudouridine synthase n=1 Tax=Roseivivax jejudonensis TaxID=1529041 RepID=A0A1X7A260_9RHOB|nr:RluA family pseudouridine synthase [Roseivivax jejudonensis]SLN67974.1 Ribosomal large subunit pseudouridine synthase D [Roseivivax jejudonensis]